jgi:hypothetical protein
VSPVLQEQMRQANDQLERSIVAAMPAMIAVTQALTKASVEAAITMAQAMRRHDEEMRSRRLTSPPMIGR